MNTRPYGRATGPGRNILGPGWRGDSCVFAPSLMGKVKSFLGSVFGTDEEYQALKSQCVQIFQGVRPGIASKADADSILDVWATAAQDSWSEDGITYNQFESDMDLASSLYDQAIARLQQGGGVTPSQGTWTTSPATGQPVFVPSQPISTGSYTPWIVAGTVGLGLIGLFALRGRRRKK